MESGSEDTRPSWDEIWMSFSDSISRRSKCTRAQVGSVLVSEDQTVLSASYNGPPPGFQADGPCTAWCPRACGVGGTGASYDNCPSVHAEVNAIARADHSRIKGATVYTNRSTCIGCAKALAAAGVVRVVHRVTEDDMHRDPDGVEEFLRQCGVVVERWNDVA